MRKTTGALINGKSKIRTRQRKMIFEISFLESGREPKTSTTFDETNEVVTCNPIKAIKNNRPAKNADTPPTKAISLDKTKGVLTADGTNTNSPKTPTKTAVRDLLINVFSRALLTSLSMSVLPLCFSNEPARSEKID